MTLLLVDTRSLQGTAISLDVYDHHETFHRSATCDLPYIDSAEVESHSLRDRRAEPQQLQASSKRPRPRQQ